MVNHRDVDFVLGQIGLIRRWASNTASDGGTNLTVGDSRIIHYLHQKGPKRVTDLSQDLEIAKSTVSQATARLEKYAIVHRTLVGGSTIVIDLTPRAKKAHTLAYQKRRAVIEKTLLQLPSNERAIFLKGLAKLTELADASNAESGDFINEIMAVSETI